MSSFKKTPSLIKFEAFKAKTAKLQDKIYQECKKYAEDVGKFKPGDVVYKTKSKRARYYKVLSSYYSLTEKKIVYRIEILSNKGYIQEVAEDLLNKAALSEEFLSPETPVTGSSRTIYNKDRIIRYMKTNPAIRLTEVADIFQVPYDTIVRYAKEGGIRKNGIVDIRILSDYITANPDANVRKIAFDLKISTLSVYKSRVKYNLPIKLERNKT